MSEPNVPPAQAPPSAAKDGGGVGRRPSSNRGQKRSVSNARPSSTGPNQTPSTTGGPAKNSRSTSATRKPSVNSPSTGPAARLAAGEAISRPSSTDTSGARNLSEGSGGRREGGRTRQTSRTGPGAGPKKAQPGNSNSTSNNAVKGTPVAAPAPTSAPVTNNESGSAALSSLQRVITDLKSITPNPPSSGGSASRNSTNPNTPSDNQPPRHRKSASAGASGNFGPGFASAGFANQLGAMQEDVEDGYSYAPSEEYNEQPGFNQPQMQPQQQMHQFPYGAAAAMRNMQHQPMGSFSAPRFHPQQQMGQMGQMGMSPPQEQQYGSQGEVIGPSGRPQLAPGFTFGGNRRPRAPSTVEQEDANFQFPQQQNPIPNLPSNQYEQHSQARRSVSDVPAGVNGLMAEQVRSVNTKSERSKS